MRADLVLEGGGVKGLALVGAVDGLAGAGYRFPRVAGSSAGAVVACLVAALQRAGEPLARLVDLAASLDYRALRDRGPLARLAPAPLGGVLDALAVLVEGGAYEGTYLRGWLAATLADLGVRTFADLRLPAGPGGPEPLPEHRYSLVVTASDLSRRRLVRLPWDYPAYGLDPDEQPVADAVRTSASIPFYYEPVTLRGPGGVASTLVDGGLLSNFPVALFDRSDGGAPRWPTFGVRLSARGDARVPTGPVTGPLSLGRAVLGTLLAASDARHVDDRCVQQRTVFVDTSGFSPVEFGLGADRQQELLGRGRAAAARFLARWDWARHLETCRSTP